MTRETEWPVDLRGVTESVVTTFGPNDRWNAAALGLHAGDPVTATTWGNTRTRRNFDREGGGYVQFTRDPLLFVEAALSVRETAEPPVDAAVEREVVPTTNRGYYAVVEATVAASRLDVDAYDTAALLDRLAYFEDVAETCGGERDRAAFDRLNELAGWKSQNESF